MFVPNQNVMASLLSFLCVFILQFSNTRVLFCLQWDAIWCFSKLLTAMQFAGYLASVHTSLPGGYISWMKQWVVAAMHSNANCRLPPSPVSKRLMPAECQQSVWLQSYEITFCLGKNYCSMETMQYGSIIAIFDTLRCIILLTLVTDMCSWIHLCSARHFKFE